MIGKIGKNVRLGAVAVLVALVVLLVLTVSGGAIGAGPVSDSGYGYQDSCVLDASSSCTKTHGLGKKPDAVLVQVVSPGQQANVVAVTDKQYTVKFLWRTGVGFKAGTVIRYYVHFDVPAGVVVSPSPSPTSPKPTDPPTTPTATPPPAAGVCTHPTFTTTSTDNMGDGQDFGAYYVHNNMWNNDNGTYTLGACNFDSWYVEATQPLPGDRGVQTYPNVHKDYADVPLSKIKSAKFAYTSPADCAGCIYDVAFDAWLGPDLGNELMIWTENKGQTPAGDIVAVVTFGGHTYDVWHEDGYTAYVSRDIQKSGVMPLAEFLNDMTVRGWAPKPTTWQVDFGVEVVSTANVKRRFDFTDFSIQEN